MIAAGIAFSLLAACCYAAAATLQHGAVRTVTPGETLRWAQLRALSARPRWLLGLLAQCGGGGLHVVALSLAPLVVIQPVGVLAIGLTVLCTAAAGRATLDRTTVLAVLAGMLGVGLFVVLAAHGAIDAVASVGAQSWVLSVALPTVAALVLLGWRSRGWTRCPVFATAAGMSFGVVSVLTRAVARGIREQGMAGAHIGSVLGIAGAMVVGVWCVQQSYASGRPDTVMACQTVIDPMVGVLVGLCLFGEAPNVGPLTVLGELTGAALTVVGVVALARRDRHIQLDGETRREERVDSAGQRRGVPR